jgi:phosphoribosylanthranilate isomerase
MVKIKICGITNWTDARHSIEAGANFLGFNFYRGSSRYIRPTAAARIIKRLPRGIKAVGVFVNETEENILAIAQVAGLHQIQMHGDESPRMVARVRRKFPVIKAVKVRGKLRASQLSAFAKANALLFDAFDGSQFGGAGRTFDWRLIRSAGLIRKIFLAGGLTAENVREAIRVAKPYAVDVCSGVEARPGKKDAHRIAAFMKAARAPKPAAKSVVKSGTKPRRKKQS